MKVIYSADSIFCWHFFYFTYLHGTAFNTHVPCAFRRSFPAMATRFHQINSLDDLRDYISYTLCEYNQLQLGAFPMTERILHRGGRQCGIFFCLHGPRSARFTAIWDKDRGQILFYGSQGERFLRTQLIEGSRFECSAA